MYSDEEFEDFSSYADSGHESNEEMEQEDDIEIDFGAKEEDFQVLSADQIVKHMKTSIQEIKAVIPISSTMLRILLNHFKWDQSILMEKYFSDEKDAMFAQVNSHHLQQMMTKEMLTKLLKSKTTNPPAFFL